MKEINVMWSDRCGKKFNQKGDLIVFMPRGTKRVGHLG